MAMRMKAVIRLYEHGNYEGKVLELNKSAPDFRALGFNDIISSIKAACGVWEAYEHVNYQGKVYRLEPGEYPNWQSWQGVNDQISSIKLIPSITAFEHVNFQGNALQLTVDVPNLVPWGFNDKVSSIIVNGGVWQAFEHVDYKGKVYTLDRGEYPDWKAWKGANDQISSFKCQSE